MTAHAASEARADALCDRLRHWLGPHVGVGHCAVAGAEPLWPVEALSMSRATPARQQEFAAGRTAARRALSDLGCPAAALPMRPDRAPHWPAGLTGSLTHHAGHALALVADTGRVDGLGVDLTDDIFIDPGTAAEIGFGPETTLPAALVFAAKEATYKALAPFLDAVWPFDALAVTLSGGRFAARLMRPAGPWPACSTLKGHLARVDGVVLAALVLPHGPGRD